MQEFNKFIGLDVHKSTIAISIAPEDGGKFREYTFLFNGPQSQLCR